MAGSRKIRAGNTDELQNVIKKFNFVITKHIVISVGTNDTDEGNPEEIYKTLVNIAEDLNKEYKDTNVYLSQLPPRNDNKNNKIKQLNQLLSEGTPETIHVIKHENLRIEHLHDQKHIKKNCLGLLVKNIKDKLKEVMWGENGNTIHEPYYAYNKSSTRQQHNDQNENSKEHKSITDNKKQMFFMMEKTMMENLKTMKGLFEKL